MTIQLSRSPKRVIITLRFGGIVITIDIPP